MKVAYVSEWTPDEAVARILVEAILGKTTEPIDPPIRTRGWPSVRDLLPVILTGLHYHSDADALVVVVDSNHSRLDPSKEPEGLETPEEPRLLQLRTIVENTRGNLKPRPDRRPLRIAMGLAVPCIEAWLRCGVDPNVSENAWVQALRENRRPYTRSQLKADAYGSGRAGEPIKTARSVEQARRLAKDISLLERKFPIGFGALAADVRAWPR